MSKYINKSNFKRTRKLTFKSIKKILPLKAFQDRYIKDYYTFAEQKVLRKFLNIGQGLLNYALQKRRLLYKFLEFKYNALFTTLKVLPNRFLKKNRRYFKRKYKKKKLNLRVKFFYRITYDNFLFYLNLGNKSFIIRPFNFFNSLFFYKTRTFKKAYVLRRRKRIRFKFLQKYTRHGRRYFVRRRIKFLRYRFKKKFLMKRLKKFKIRRFTNFIRFISFLNICKKINKTNDDNFKINSMFILPYKLLKFNFNKMTNSYLFFLNFKKRRLKFSFMNITENFKNQENNLYNSVKSQLIKNKKIINCKINKINTFNEFEKNVFNIDNKLSINSSNEQIKNLVFKKTPLTQDEYNLIFKSTKPLILTPEERKIFIFKIQKFDRDEKLILLDKKTLSFKEKIKLEYDSEEEFDESYLEFGQLYKTEEEWLYGIDYENDLSYKFNYGKNYSELDKVIYFEKYNNKYIYSEEDKKFVPNEIYLYYVFYFLIQKLLFEYNWSYSINENDIFSENLDNFSFGLVNFDKYQELEDYEEDEEDYSSYEDYLDDNDHSDDEFFFQKKIHHDSITQHFDKINTLNNLIVSNSHDYFELNDLFDSNFESDTETINEFDSINELEIVNFIILIEKLCKKLNFFKNKIKLLNLKKKRKLSKLFLKFSLIKKKLIKKYEYSINNLFIIINKLKKQLNILFLNFYVLYIYIFNFDNFNYNSLLIKKIIFFFKKKNNSIKKTKKLIFSLLFFKKKNLLLFKNNKFLKVAKNKLNHRIFKKRWRRRKFLKKKFSKQKNRFFKQINKKFYLPSFNLYKNCINTQFNLNGVESTLLFNKKLKCFYLSNFKKLNLISAFDNQNFKNINFLKY